MLEEREQLCKDTIELQMTRGTKGLAQGFTSHIRDCSNLLKEFQEKVKEESIFNCWRKSTLLNQPIVSKTTSSAVVNLVVLSAITAAWNVIDIK